jgi:hypothetical protein
MIAQVLRVDVYLLAVVRDAVETAEASRITKVHGWIFVLGALVIVSPHVGGHDGCVSTLDRPHGCRISMPSGAR